ncbi:G-box-binding factor-like [Teleopsis dalmanni]|uniref:G-box-binding factor-like n=1 Tax=Teleopsis dalmanni TaxID=139649 RepID=UPI0018CE2AC7|nr:G-box-binding factor-like [Teleopsis dalmanni]
MRYFHQLIGLLLFGLLIQNGLADISLTLRGGKGKNFANSQREYLPPSAQEVSINQNYDNTNFGHSQYQVFEVHNHYTGSSGESNNDLGSREYLPPAQEIHIQHIHQGDHLADDHLADDHLDVSFLGLAAGQVTDGEQITIIENTPDIHHEAPVLASIPVSSQVSVSAPVASPAPVSLPEPNIPVPFPSNYKHDFQKNENEANNLNVEETYEEAGYLPPYQGTSVNAQVHNENYNQGGDHFQAPDYLPPHQEQAVHQQQGRVQQHHHEQIVSSQQASGYLPPHQEQVVHQQLHQQHTVSSQQTPGYLAPYQEKVVHHHHHHQHQHQQQNQVQHQHHEHIVSSQQTPGYLPPHQEQVVHQQNQQQSQVQTHQHDQHAVVTQQTHFKAPDYLPPNKESSIVGVQQHAHAPQAVVGQPTAQAYRAPGYLPPHTAIAQQQLSHGQQQNYQQQVQHTVQHQQNIASAHFKGPSYLPPHTEHVQHQQHNHVSSIQNIAQVNTAYRAPDYLPPHVSTTSASQQNYNGEQRTQHSVAPATTASGYLPPGYDFDNPEQKQIQNIQQQAISSHASTQFAEAPAAPPATLPLGYDFVKPNNAEAAIAELHTLPDEHEPEQNVQNHVQPQAHYSSTLQHQQQRAVGVSTSAYQANGYLPPHTNSGAAVSTASTQSAYQSPAVSVQQPSLYNVRNIFNNLVSAQQQRQVQPPQYKLQTQQHISTTVSGRRFKGPDYLPPYKNSPPASVSAVPASNSQIHSLSSYMIAVQPYQRYGAAQFTQPRMPFAKYGPPTSLQVQQPIEVAPMYREPTTRPQYYAPSMSYATNTVAQTHQSVSQIANQQLNNRAQQSLRQLMPYDVRQHSSAAAVSRPLVQKTVLLPVKSASVSQHGRGKVRTVQILNSSQVKTLKVLETSDNAGVKTIKILGVSKETPMGDHRIVKVVSKSSHNGAENHIQTVKIFNDQKDVSLQEANVPTRANNAYLPPRRPRSTRLRPAGGKVHFRN